jgi:hypothetical protein
VTVAIVLGYVKRDDGRTQWTVAGENYTRPQVIIERGAEHDPELHRVLDLAALTERERYSRPIRSATQRS